MLDATFSDPDLTTFTGLDDLGLRVRLRRYRCIGYGHVWRQDLTRAAPPRCKLTKTALAWALEGLVVAHLSISRIAQALEVAWDTAVLEEGRRVLISNDARFEGVKVLGVDEHVWRHTRRGDEYVTVVIDLTGVRDGTGPARLLDMIESRSKAAFTTWLDGRDKGWRDRVGVVAMVPRKREVPPGFSGFKTAAAEEVPQATAVMDPFGVVRLAADALDECRRRTQRTSSAAGAVPVIRCTRRVGLCTQAPGC